jgi:hypothetical protein
VAVAKEQLVGTVQGMLEEEGVVKVAAGGGALGVMVAEDDQEGVMVGVALGEAPGEMVPVEVGVGVGELVGELEGV